MTIPTGFKSWRDYVSFTTAREFVPRDENEAIEIPQNRIERVGRAMSAVLLRPLDFFIREIQNPLMLLALTATAIALVSIAFYPAQTVAAALFVLPFLKYTTVAHLHMAVYLVAQVVIAGIGLIALGRICNGPLRKAYQDERIYAVPFGAVKI